MELWALIIVVGGPALLVLACVIYCWMAGCKTSPTSPKGKAISPVAAGADGDAAQGPKLIPGVTTVRGRTVAVLSWNLSGLQDSAWEFAVQHPCPLTMEAAVRSLREIEVDAAEFLGDYFGDIVYRIFPAHENDGGAGQAGGDGMGALGSGIGWPRLVRDPGCSTLN